MADFTELNAQEEAYSGRIDAQEPSSAVHANKLAAQSTIRLADVVAPVSILRFGSFPSPGHLARQKSEAYASLVHSAGAIRFSTSFVRRALRGLGFGENR